MIYSASRLETYRQCPQKFKFTYLDKVESTVEGIEAFMGSRVHEALEKLYTDLRFCKATTLPELLTNYHELWTRAWHEQVQIVRENRTPDDYEAMGEQSLISYYQRYAPFNQSQTLGLEHPVKLHLDAKGEYQMQGYIDRLSSPAEGVLWIHDYKTKGFFPTQQSIDEDRQLAYYQMALQQLWPETKEITLIWHYLIFDYEFRSKRSIEELESLRQETLGLIREIESAIEFPPRESALCNWCEYQAICPIFSPLSLAPHEYQSHEGVQWVERLNQLQCEEEVIKGKINQIKASLAAYATQKGVEVIMTQTHKALIRHYENVPREDAHGRALLEQLLKAEGKWGEASSLDGFLLSKTMKTGDWSAELIARVKKLGVIKKMPWIKVVPREKRSLKS